MVACRGWIEESHSQRENSCTHPHNILCATLKCFILKLQAGSLYTQSDWLDTGPVMSVDVPPRAYWLPRSLDVPLLSKGLTNPLSPCAGEFRPSTNVGVSLFVSVLMSRLATLSVHGAGRGKRTRFRFRILFECIYILFSYISDIMAGCLERQTM